MAAFSYEYVMPGVHKVPAQIAGETLEAIRLDGGLTPQRVVDASRDKNAPLHGEFEWDDAKAAEGYRREQASGLIRNVRVIAVNREEKEIRPRAFVCVNRGTHEYEPLHIVRSSPAMMDAMLEQARRDLTAFSIKYGQLTELSGVIEPIMAYLNEK